MVRPKQLASVSSGHMTGVLQNKKNYPIIIMIIERGGEGGIF